MEVSNSKEKKGLISFRITERGNIQILKKRDSRSIRTL